MVFFSEIGQLAAKVFVQFKGQINEFVTLFIEQIKALPIFSMIKEKLEEVGVSYFIFLFKTKGLAVFQIKVISANLTRGY